MVEGAAEPSDTGRQAANACLATAQRAQERVNREARLVKQRGSPVELGSARVPVDDNLLRLGFVGGKDLIKDLENVGGRDGQAGEGEQLGLISGLGDVQLARDGLEAARHGTQQADAVQGVSARAASPP